MLSRTFWIRYLTRWKLFSGLKTINTQNCWFCNEDCDVQLQGGKPGWTCPSCQQYNGFNEDGDYDHPIVEQHENSVGSKRYCQKESFDAGDSILCRTCHQNQVLKVGQLATFIPLSESSFGEEVDTYGEYLDSVYRLCRQCHGKVNARLTEQDEEILRKLGKENLMIRKDGKVDVTSRDVRFLSEKMSLKYWGKLMFLLSLLMSVVNMLVSGRLCLEGKNQRFNVSFLQRVYPYIHSLTSMLPLKEMQNTVQKAIYIGTGCCVLGLFTVEKACIYGVDALHILLWLLLLICNAMTSYGVRPFLLGPDIASLAYLILSMSTVLVCLASLRRSRRPKHMQSNIEMSFSRHLVTTPKPAVKVTEKEKSLTTPNDMSKSPSFNAVSSFSSSLSSSRSSSPFPTQVGEARNFFKPISSSPPGSPSSFSSISPGIPQTLEKPKSVFEIVRHGLESFSLGIGKKSGSTSSIWSIPSIVTSEVQISPDSTLPNKQQEIQRDILSPSRLSFVSFSRSPSPGKFSSSPSSEVDSRSVPDDNQQLNFKNMNNQVIGSASPTNQARRPYSAKEMRPLSYSSSFHIIQRDKSFTQLYGGDSDTFTAESNKLRSNLKSCREKVVAIPDSSTPNDYGKTQVKNGPRRSNRIAMHGRILKPWPLKKSWSENNMYDKCDDDKRARKGKDLMMDESGQGKSGFHPFKFGQLEVLSKEQTDRQMDSPHLLSSDRNSSELVRRHGFTRKMDSIAESSDDDEMGSPWKSNNKLLLRTESSKTAESKWIWTLFGLLIGISGTVNVFLAWNLWNKGTS